MKKHLSFSKEIVFLLFLGSIALPSFAQVQQAAPPIKTAHTILHKAVQKDTAWVMDPVVDRIYFVKFDNRGRKWVENSLNPDGSADRKIVYAYDEAGNVKKEVYKSPLGEIKHSTVLSYSPNGELRSKTILDSEDKTLRKGLFRYDVEGNCINETWFGTSGSKYSEFRYTYDPYGHQIEKKVLLQPEKSSDYEPVERSWSFKGQLLEEWIGNSPELRHRTYKYSTKGEVIGGTEQPDGRSAQPYIYKFYNDDRGNWTKRIKFVEDIPVLYEERELVYFTKQ